MKFNQRLRQAFKILSTTNLSNSVTGQVMRNYGMRGNRFRPLEQVSGITYKAIDKIGLSLSIYEPVVIRRNGEAFENHPLYSLFENPNPTQTASDFIHLYGMLNEIYGETFWYLVRGETTRRVKEIYLLNPASMELKIDGGELVGYILHKADGSQIPFTLDEVIHDKRPNPFNEWRGMSVLERASIYVDTEITTSTFTLNYMRNNASPSGIVSLPAMDKETFKQFAAQWREGYEGPENAGKTAFIRNGEASFQAVGATLKDVDAKVTRDMAKEDVLMMLEVPKPLLGMTDDKGFGRGNVETLHYIFANEKLEPLMRRLDRIYYKILISSGFQDLAYDVTHESPVPEDKEYQLNNAKAGANIWLTVNEIRQQQGLPPLNGYDDIINPMQTTIAASAVNTVNKEVKKVTLSKEVKLTKSQELKKINEEQESFRANLVDTNEPYEKKLKSIISKFALQQEEKIISKIGATKKAYEEWLFSIKEESEVLAGLLTPVILDLMEEQIAETANFISGELLTISPEIRGRVEITMKQIAGVYNQDTITALERSISEGVDSGESLVKIKKRVENIYQDAKGYRAERIARTESLRASNESAELVYKSNGFSQVRWFSNPGACDFCKELNATVKSIGNDFYSLGDVITNNEGQRLQIDYRNITTPPLHPNCKCSIVPEN